MHPGRMFVGEIEFDRAREQFDLTGAELFDSFGEAEPACSVRRGFLLELYEASPDHDAGQTRVLFVGGLRPPR